MQAAMPSKRLLRLMFLVTTISIVLASAIVAWYFDWMLPVRADILVQAVRPWLPVDAIRDAQRERDMLWTGQITGPSTAGTWRLIGGTGVNGSWVGDRYDKVRAMEVYRGKLVVGTGGATLGDGEAWEWNGHAWTQFGGDGIAGSWAGDVKRQVNFLLADGQDLYAGVGSSDREGSAEVWLFDGKSWRMLGGARLGPSNGWPQERFDLPYSAAIFGGTLHVGMSAQGQSGDGLVMRYLSGRWEIVGGDGRHGSWSRSADYHGIYDLVVYRGDLYAGTWGFRPNTGTVWRYDRSRWEKIGGDGLNGSWRNRNIWFVEDLAVHRDRLVASLQRNGIYFKETSSVWSYDGSSWRQLGQSTSRVYDRSTVFNYLVEHSGTLVLATGGTIGSSIWSYGDKGKWLPFSRHSSEDAWRNRDMLAERQLGNFEWIYRMISLNGMLYVGLAGYPGGAQVWQYEVENAQPSTR
jgi:hypothetical protein